MELRKRRWHSLLLCLGTTAAGILLLVTRDFPPDIESRRLPAATRGREKNVSDSAATHGTQDTPDLTTGSKAESLVTLGRTAFDSGKYSDAESFFRKALELLDAESLAGAETTDLLVRSLLRQGRFRDPETRALAEHALRVKESWLGPDDPRLDRSLRNLGNQLQLQAEYDRALAIFERLLALRQKYEGPKSKGVAEARTYVGLVLRQKGDYEAAKLQFEGSLAIQPPGTPEQASSLWYLGVVLDDLGEYGRSRRSYRQALEIRTRVYGDSAAVVAKTVSGLAEVERKLGSFAEARRLFEWALGIQEKMGVPYDIAETSQNLAFLLATMGDYDDARPYCERALALRAESLGPKDPFYAASLCDLAYFEYLTGDYGSSLAHLDQGLQIAESSLGELHPSIAEHLGNWVDALLAVGDYSEARRLSLRALSIQERALGRRHPWVGRTLHRLGCIHLATGEAEAALAPLEEALSIAEGSVGGDQEAARITVDLATALARSGNQDRAQLLFDRAVRTLEDILGANHPAVAEGKRAFAAALFAAGDPASARLLYEQAARALESSLGADAPPLRIVLGELAEVLACLGDTEGALGAALRSESIARAHLRLTARALPERQALQYATLRGPGLDVALSLDARRALPDKASSRVWDAVVRSRSLVLDEMAARHRTVESNADPEIVRLAAELAVVQQRLANLVVRGPGAMSTEAHRRLVGELEREAERRMRALAQRSRTFRERERLDRMGGTQVAAALPRGAALISFVRYRDVSCPGSPPTPAGDARKGSRLEGRQSYLAFVLAPGSRGPRVVPLGDAASIGALVERWRISLVRGDRPQGQALVAAEAACRAAGDAVRRAVWDSVAARLGDVQRVFLVPDGLLQLVDVSVLPVGETAYFAERGPVVHVLTTERDLLAPREPSRARGLLALGDPDFEASLPPASSAQDARLAEAADATRPRSAATDLPPHRGLGTYGIEFESVRFRRLPASGQEVEDLVALWRRAHRSSAAAPDWVLLTRADANEKAFKRMAPGRSVLHVAAHGFFFEAAPRGVPAGTGGPADVSAGTSAEVSSLASNPLLLAGIALAGANRRAQAGPEEDDGILTPEEVAGMNLEGTDLVVLSACDTGVGRLHSGEGVLGLRRAFAIAGARTQVTSLWPVRDEAASRWMKSFYESKLLRGLGTADAARRASLECLAWCREHMGSSHPMFWAGFVATGAPESPPEEAPAGIVRHGLP